ncbi:MAG: hypothetical protein HY282_14750 [Nitrospirae bacterium]|nr:hypothetical protein [Candidatus Manganitrophaceae bacterium]
MGTLSPGKELKQRVFTIITLAALLTALWGVQKELHAYKTVEIESLIYLPSGKYLRPLALGYDQVAADILWMKAVSYFGGHYLTDKQYPWLYHILTLIIDLDPRFDFPYYFGGVVLSLEASQVDQANQILERGMEAYPQRWEFPFYVGFNYFYHKQDASKAIPYLERASSLPKSPPYLKVLVAHLSSKSGQKEAALNFYREAYQHTSDGMIRQKIKEKIDRVLSGEEKYGTGDTDTTSH